MQTNAQTSDLLNPAMRSALAGFFALAIAMGIGRFVYTPILPFMIDVSTLSTSQGGVAAGSNFIGYLIGALLAALPIFGPNRSAWALVALLVSAATTALSGLWLSTYALEFFYFVRFIAGFASAFTLIFVSTIVMQQLQSENKPELISVQFAGVGFGICISSLIVSLGANAGLSWNSFWYGAALLCIILLAFVFMFLPKQNAPQTMQTVEATTTPQQTPTSFTASFWLLLIGYGVFGFAYSITGTFINTIAKIEPALNSAQPYVWMVVGLAIMPSTWVWFKVARRLGELSTYAIACIVEALGVLLIYWLVTPASLLLSGFLFGFTFIAMTAIGLAKARRMAGSRGAQAIALMTASFGLGQMLGPIFAGFSAESSGNFDNALILSVIMLLLTCIFTLIAKKMDVNAAIE